MGILTKTRFLGSKDCHFEEKRNKSKETIASKINGRTNSSFLFFKNMEDSIKIQDAIKIDVGKIRLLFAIEIFETSRNNLKLTTPHKIRKRRKNKDNQNITAFFLLLPMSLVN